MPDSGALRGLIDDRREKTSKNPRALNGVPKTNSPTPRKPDVTEPVPER
jgi:hypothetical protein